MLRRVFARLAALALVASFVAPSVARAGVGELVFLKPDAAVHLTKKQVVDPSLVRFPAVVEATKDGLYWIGRGWVKPCDVMCVDEAFGCFSRMTAERPQSPVGWANLAAVRLATGDAGGALDDVGRALACEPHNPVWLSRRGDAFTALGLHQEALCDYRAAAAASPVWPPAVVRLGDALVRRGDYHEACECYLLVKKLDPAEPYCYFGFANARLALCDYKKAAEAYTSALKCDPFLTAAYLNRAEAFWAVGKYDAVVADATGALQCDPTMAVAHLTRGRAWDAAGKYTYASQDFAAAVGLEPNNAVARKQAALFFASCHDPRFRDPSLAVEHAHAAVELTAHADADALAILAAAYNALGDRSHAAEYDALAAEAARGTPAGTVIEESRPSRVESRMEELPTPAEPLPAPPAGDDSEGPLLVPEIEFSSRLRDAKNAAVARSGKAEKQTAKAVAKAAKKSGAPR